VNELIDYAIDRVSQRARDRGITLSHSLDVERAWGDVVLLRRATIALLVHAIRETPRDGVVTLKASLVQDAGKQMFAVSVTDGAGALFPRTARWPLSSLMPAFPCNGSRRGITLDEVGLAFCEMMAALQGGNAWIVSGEPAGNTLSYAIPFPDPGMPVA